MKRLNELSPVAHRIVDAAEQLIQQYGYNGFSYDDISRQVGLKKPSIHHHFQTKSILVAMVVERYSYRFKLLLDEIDSQSLSATAKLKGYIDLFSSTYETNRRLCVCGMLGAETDILPTEIVSSVSQFFEMNQNWLARVLESGVSSKEFILDLLPAKHALYLLSSLEGAMIVGRGLSSDGTLREVAQTALSAVIAK
jgi:TetR/AcrR family transcriptional regulator, transcriptional repressor for nem operon